MGHGAWDVGHSSIQNKAHGDTSDPTLNGLALGPVFKRKWKRSFYGKYFNLWQRLRGNGDALWVRGSVCAAWLLCIPPPASAPPPFLLPLPSTLFLSFIVSHLQLSEVKTGALAPFPLHSRGEPLERGVLLVGLSFPSERVTVWLELWMQCQGFPSHREVHVPCEL